MEIRIEDLLDVARVIEKPKDMRVRATPAGLLLSKTISSHKISSLNIKDLYNSFWESWSEVIKVIAERLELAETEIHLNSEWEWGCGDRYIVLEEPINRTPRLYCTIQTRETSHDLIVFYGIWVHPDSVTSSWNSDNFRKMLVSKGIEYPPDDNFVLIQHPEKVGYFFSDPSSIYNDLQSLFGFIINEDLSDKLHKYNLR